MLLQKKDKTLHVKPNFATFSMTSANNGQHMFLKKITLTNFRQFYGTQELLIAGHLKKNVTLIHAENGVGFFTATLFDKFYLPGC